jgi:hypothetical protein
MASKSIYAAAEPTFLYFIGGPIFNDNVTRAYGMVFSGEDPLFKIDVTITDNDALVVEKEANGGRSDLYERHLMVPVVHDEEEIDPAHRDPVKWYPYKPFRLNSEDLAFTIRTRTIDIDEQLRVYQTMPHTLPAYYEKLINARTDKLLKECISDSRFATFDPHTARLPLCCDPTDPQEGIYASCAPLTTRVARSIKERMALAWRGFVRP